MAFGGRLFKNRNDSIPAGGKGIERGQRLPRDLWGRAALDSAGEYDCHALPDGVGPQGDREVGGFLTQTLQVLHVGGCLLLCLERRRGTEDEFKTSMIIILLASIWVFHEPCEKDEHGN